MPSEKAKSGSHMSMISNGFRFLSASTIVLASVFTMPGVAHAQLFFDWGGGSEKVNDTGRQFVRINTDAKPGEIIVSFTDRKLYLITGPGQALSYPVAIPREQDRWEGKTSVTQKRENPSWTPTPTMIKENPRLPRWVPGGHPMNPLGNRALYLGSSFYRIHGTDAPWTIGTAVSKGCIRMYNKDALDVYERSKVGAKVLVTWNAYQVTPDSEEPSTAAARDDAPASARAGGSSRRNAERETVTPAAASAPVAAAATSVPAAAPAGQKRAETRYSEIFGTPEPTAPAAAARPAGESDAARAGRQPRETQAQREPRKSSDAKVERVRAEPTASPAVTPQAAGASDAAPSKPKAAEQRQRPTPVETGSLPERRAKPKAATTEQAAAPTLPQAQVIAPAQPDAATRAVEAAERAAAAAERAAAAAERAERAVAARAAAPAPAPEPGSGGSD